MAAWCASHGIDHLLTTPYTSAHNGHTECIHCTILNKARAMHLACNAPLMLWDEFCCTVAYLTNFTATPTLGNKTPFELWFNRKLSLSHLREIGCRAFALIQTHNPKIYWRSNPCILIGYAPNSKAYHLWDGVSGKVFNSFHVTFVEHLDNLPHNLLPGKLVTLLKDSSPSWAVSGDEPASPSPDLTPSPPDTSPPFYPRSASLPIPSTIPSLNNIEPNTVNQDTVSQNTITHSTTNESSTDSDTTNSNTADSTPPSALPPTSPLSSLPQSPNLDTPLPSGSSSVCRSD